MRIDVLTLFPEFFTLPFGTGIFKRAAESGKLAIGVHNIRDYSNDKHRTVDDSPYGGGPGMVLKPEPIWEALEALKVNTGPSEEDIPVILLTPQGRVFTQQVAQELAAHNRLVLVCGHYEGVDERVREHMITDEISIGDYVLTGGELPAMVVMDGVLRLIPGILGSEESPLEESHAGGLLEYPQYTRPADFRGWQVPEILLSGNHGQIARWRREQIVRRTLERRPELLEKAELDTKERKLVQQLAKGRVKKHN